MRIIILTAFISLMNCHLIYSQDIKPVIKILNFGEAPVTISQAGAEYYNDNVYQGIKCFAKIKNNSSKKIIGVAVTALYYSIFDEFIGWVRGSNIIIVKTGAEYKLEFFATLDLKAPYLLHTAIFYPSIFRFEDGEIWKVNNEDVKNEIKKINPSFDLTFFDKK